LPSAAHADGAVNKKDKAAATAASAFRLVVIRFMDCSPCGGRSCKRIPLDTFPAHHRFNPLSLFSRRRAEPLAGGALLLPLKPNRHESPNLASAARTLVAMRASTPMSAAAKDRMVEVLIFFSLLCIIILPIRPQPPIPRRCWWR
jgi:hypothetical protein